MKKVLICSEFSHLHTGYAVYCKELLTRLHRRYNVAEFAAYCDPIEHQQLILNSPWKIYPNCPNKNNEEEVIQYESDQFNTFGKWKLEAVINDFKPHIVIAITDYWMASFINESPLRKFFNYIWMVPCDSYPQHEEWIDNFAQCDGITTYTDWGKKVLESQGIKVFGVTSPGKNNNFKPISKQILKTNYGLQDKTIIGTVMRNQKRKLFPDLFEAFEKFLIETNRKDVLLYCHTSYPDVGFDLPKLLLHHGISSKVLFSYRCKNCRLFFPSFFSDVITQCPRCKQLSAQTINVANGISSEELNVVYNLFDLYIQPATIEGFGIPLAEAATCNVPIAATNFSAMEDITDKLNGYKIDVLRTTLEQETGRYIPTISIDSIVNILTDFCSLPQSIRLKRGYDTGKLCEQYFNWDKTELVWKNYIDQVDEKIYDKRWQSPIYIHQPNMNCPNNLSNSMFVQWALVNILGDPSKIGTFLESKLSKQLNIGVVSSHFLAGYSDDLSMFGKPKIQQFTRDHCVQYLLNILEKRNFWEKVRTQ